MEPNCDASPLHVVAFPWLAFGHIIPYLELGKRLAEKGHAVTFVSAPRNISRLPRIPSDLSARIRLVSLPLPSVDGLSEGAESTADVPPEKVGLLKMAFDGLAAPFAAFLAAACDGGEKEEGGFKRKPDWIFVDFAHQWLWPIADEHKVPCAMFSIFPAAMLAFVGPRQLNASRPRTAVEDFMVPPEWIPFPSTIAYRRRYQAELIAASFRPNESGVSDMDRFWQMEQRYRVIICRSSHELEPRLFPLLTDLFAKPFIPAGILQPSDAIEDDHEGSAAARSDVEQCLDKQPPGSVIYVALGSEAPLTVEAAHELALGLELAGVRFLFVLRNPNGAASDDIGTLLPNGFAERTRARGVVRVGWVPQVRVLAHAAVGAFLTHSGLTSLIESLRFGLPLVMLPLTADQPLVVQAVAEREIGVEVPRNDSDGSFDRDGVAWAVRRVMAEEEGKVFARNARQLQEVVGDRRRQEQYIDDLVEHLRRYKYD